MNVLVIGGGGREHAIITALAKSKKVDKLYAAPGNGGISKYAECFNVKATDIDGCVELAKKLRPDYVFVAPDDPLVMGMVDKLNAEGFKTFGPRANAAILEGSKVFSKALMKSLTPDLLAPHRVRFAPQNHPLQSADYTRSCKFENIVLYCVSDVHEYLLLQLFHHLLL